MIFVSQSANYPLDSLIKEIEEIKKILGKTIVTKKNNKK